MASKMIAVREDLYEKLSKMKTGNQSFSDVIEDLLSKVEKNPLEHFGIGKSLDEKDLDDFEEILLKSREMNKMTKLNQRWDD